MLQFLINICIFTFVQSQSPPAAADDYDYPEPPPGICTLPPELGFSGTATPLIDCKNLDLFESPPCFVANWGGNHPHVCCPEDQKGLPSIDDYGEDYFAGLTDGCDDIDYPIKCQLGASCVSITQCGTKGNFLICTKKRSRIIELLILDFSNPDSPPTYCQLDRETGDDKVCCSDLKQAIGDLRSPQPPKFPAANSQPRPCNDQAKYCQKWLESDKESCQPQHKSYKFMREACHQTCGRCGNHGCVDQFELCPEWSRKGQCSIHPVFMSFYCRESCGSCGFKSGNDESSQKVNKRIKILTFQHLTMRLNLRESGISILIPILLTFVSCFYFYWYI